LSELLGRLALVTGASRGIGCAIADRLYAAGAHVIGLARSLQGEGRERRTDIACDLTKDAEVERAVERVLEIGVPDIVVNNAGTFLLRPLSDTTPAEFDRQIAVNLRGAFLILRLLVPHLRRKGPTHVVTIGSVADHAVYPGNAAYGASKFGLRGLHQVLARELAGTTVRTTLISPGPTDTEIWDALDDDGSERSVDRADMLQADDVAQAVLFAVTRPSRVNIELIRLAPAG